MQGIVISLMAFAMIMAAPSTTWSQTTLMTGLKLVDRSSSKNYEWKVNSSATGNIGFTFPSSPGTVGQVVRISSVSGTDATIGWTTPVAVATGTSARMATDVDDLTSWSTGPLISVSPNKQYRVVGEFAIKRGTTGGNDDFKIRLASDDAGTTVACAIECLDCPAGTTGVPQYVSGTNSNIDFTTIDPNGNMEGIVYHYRIEGLFKTDAAGVTQVRLTFNKVGGSETTTMMANSYWALIEIN